MTIGHNNGPDIDGQKQSIRTRWVKALLADTNAPTYVMAMVLPIYWYSRHDGTGAAISNQQFQDMCGVSEASATRGKKWLLSNGYVQITVGRQHQKTQFRICLPDQPRVITQTTLTQGHQTEDPHREDPPTDDRRVVPQTTLFSKGIQDNKKGASTNFWKQALNPEHSDYSVDGDGTVVLFNGTRSQWLLEFGDDATELNFALKQISQYVQPNSPKGLKVQVEAQLSRIAREKRDKDRRYAQAVKTKTAPAKPFKPSRW